MAATFTIGALARKAGTSPETIRWYERARLMPPPARTGANYRVYAEPALRRLLFIRRARELGFGVDQVRTLAELSEDLRRDCAEVDRMSRAHLEEVERRIADLRRLRRALRRIIGDCRSGSVAECRILHALQPEPAPTVAGAAQARRPRSGPRR
ncbi:MAG: MerR family DNA-binding protein [Acidobacteria bacterium]|nr:MerR family DNA-binding protein [Acidobacteriota bacterium]